VSPPLEAGGPTPKGGDGTEWDAGDDGTEWDAGDDAHATSKPLRRVAVGTSRENTAYFHAVSLHYVAYDTWRFSPVHYEDTTEAVTSPRGRDAHVALAVRPTRTRPAEGEPHGLREMLA
jgi:hypothetical protein